MPSRLKVLESFQQPRATTNPYIVMLLAALREVCDVQTFSWRRALTTRYNVFHVHWPEVLLGSNRLSRRVARRICFFLLLGHLKAHRIAVVRTAHNLTPHEQQSRIDSWLIRRLDKLTVGWIRLNPETPLPKQAEVATILHGHYCDWFTVSPALSARPNQLIFYGQVRPYKGVDQLITVFRELPDPTARLIVLGNPNTSELRTELTAKAAGDDRIQLDLTHASDEAMANAITASSLVVLPYTQMHNSGALLVALSLGRPALIPDTGVNRELAAEVGPQWLHLYDGPLTPEILAKTLETPLPQGSPDLSARNWDTAAQAHLDIFERAASRTRQV